MDAEAEAGPSGTSPAPAPPPSSSDAAWTKTRSGKRILELQDVEESIAQLLHFAGCTLASIHPDPLSSFTSKTVDFSDDPSDDDDGDSPPPPAPAPPADKETEFANYAEAYYTTLNDIQLSLRTSIRHLRLSRASPAPLIDPHFGSLSNPGGGGVGVGGVALGKSLRPLGEQGAGAGGGGGGRGVSVAAMELEREAWEEVGRALGRREKEEEGK